MSDITKAAKEKDKFIELCQDVLPIADQLNGTLEKHGIKALAGITLSTDGYMNFYTHETEWEMTRKASGEHAMISFSDYEYIYPTNRKWGERKCLEKE